MTEEAEAGGDTSVSHGGQITSRFASDSVGDEAELSVVRAEGKDARGEMKHEHAHRPDVEGSCYSVAGKRLLRSPIHWRANDFVFFRRQHARCISFRSHCNTYR